jgi:hypothetical protein
MDYIDIPGRKRKFVRKATYNKLDDKQKRMYLKSIRELVKKFDETGIKSDPFDDDEPKLRRRIMFSSMDTEYYHAFSRYDKVKLKKDDDMIKVLVKNGNKWKQESWVDHRDVKWLQSVHDFENYDVLLD